MTHQPEKIWVEQADAAGSIREDHGLDQALSYLVSEKFVSVRDVVATPGRP